MRTTWAIDAGHSSLLFTIRHLVIAKVRGRFSRFGGALELDDADLARSSARIEVDVASIDTALEPRDAHLRSPDFFDVARFPTATLISRSIAKRGDDYVMLGELSLHGIAQEIELQVAFGGKARDPRGRERVAFSASATIDREAFGLRWNQLLEAGGVAVGRTAELAIELQALAA